MPNRREPWLLRLRSFTQDPIDILLTTQEVAARWRVHIDTVKLRRKKGLIKGIRMNPGYQSRLADVRKFEEDYLR